MNWLMAAPGVALAVILGASPVQAEDKPSAPAAIGAEALAPDPAIRRGVLANGLRYVILPNASPRGALSVRLAVEVGGFEEADAELGAAHFVEHMAFRATRRFPEGELERALAPLGVAAGRDHNAATSNQSTIYQLDLPDTSAQHLDLAFRWLRDVADGVTFDVAAVERERGVVLAERDARNDPASAIGEEIGRFQAPGLRTISRPVIGEAAVLRSLRPEALQAFYRRWYRPEHAIVAIVGDLPAETLEARIREAFGDWAGHGPRPSRPPAAAPDAARGLDVFARSEPRLPAALSICRLAPPPPAGLDGLASLRRRIETQVWSRILQRRVAQLRYRTPAIQQATAFGDVVTREASLACVLTALERDGWNPALKAVQDEIRRFDADGPTEAEVEEAIQHLRGELGVTIAQTGSRASAALADALAGDQLQGRVTQEPRQALRSFNRAVEGLTPEAVRAAWKRDWSGAGPLVAAVAPSAPSREAVLAAWTTNAAAAPVQAAAYEPPQWAYGSLGAPGKVERREEIADPGFVRVRFKNGVVLNFKRTGFVRNTVQIVLDLGEGRRELGDRSVFEGEIAAGLLIEGGLGRHSYRDLEAMVGGDSLDMEFRMSPWSFSFAKGILADNLALQLTLLSAYVSDPGFRPELDGKIAADLDAYERMRRTSIPMVLGQALVDAVDPGGAQAYPAPGALPAAAAPFGAFLKPILTGAPLELTIVGDIDEAAATDLVSRTFGALPPRTPRPSRAAYSRYIRFPATPPPTVRTLHEAGADKAAVQLVWPLYVASKSRRREEYALDLISRILDDEVRHAVRERLGKTYTPEVMHVTPDDADQAYIAAMIETSPADLALVEAEVRGISRRLAEGGITAEILEAARKPALTGAKADLQTNEWWAWHLVGSSRDPQLLKDLHGRAEALESLSLEEVRRTAAAWLGAPPIVIQALPETRP